MYFHELYCNKNTSELGLYTANPLSIMFSGTITHTLDKLKTVGIIDSIRKSAKSVV